MQDFRGLRAHAPAQLGVVDQRFAVGGDHRLQPGRPAASLQLVLEAPLDDPDHDPHGRRCSWGRSQQRHQRTVGGAHDLGSELEDAPVPRIALDDLHALARHFRPPVGLVHLREECAQRLESLLLRLEHLADQVLGEVEVVARNRQHRPDVVEPYRTEHVGEGTVLQEPRREPGVGTEQQVALPVDDAGVEVWHRHRRRPD